MFNMTGFPARRRSSCLTLALLCGLLLCSAASADLIALPDPAPGDDATLVADALDPFYGIPGSLDDTSPEAIQLTSYWYTVISDPWGNYTLLVDLFGPGAAASLAADETPAPLLDPSYLTDTGVSDRDPVADTALPLSSTLAIIQTDSAADVTPEPATSWMTGCGLFALALLTLRGRLRPKQVPPHPR